MKSFLFIESPLQLLNANEAVNRYSLDDYNIIVRLSNNEKSDEQIIYIIKQLGIENIKYIKINVSNKNIIDYIKLLFYRFRYIFTKVNKIFIGNCESGFLKLILKQFDKEDIILLDDGAKSIDIQKNFNDEVNYNLFTMYDLKPYQNQIIDKNNYEKLQKDLKQLKINTNQVLFLGLKLSEIGITSEEYYLKKIKQISAYYNNAEILYISHRGETHDKLEKIKSMADIEVIVLDYPVELYGLYNDDIPYKVASFYSTALLTMKNIYGIEAESFMFDYQHSKYKEIIENVYDYYKDYLEVIDLDD
jgi:hypothetical protein